MTLDLVKLLAIACLAIGVLIATFVLVQTTDSPLHRVYHRYVASLERRMRIMFIDTPVLLVLIGQGGGALLTLALALFTRNPLWLAMIAPVALAPTVLLEHKRKKRVAQIEQKLEGFLLALANALRASPSAGRALAMVQPVTPAPLDREIELVLREMRIGSTLEQALANLSARVQSFQLDAAMSCLLIGRQTGGNVPQILDGAAHTLREITRLQGVLRTKTAEGRAQANVLAVFPLALIVAFELVKPGYFEPLLESPTGLLIVVLAIAMWIGSVVIMRRIMAVQL
ncbi:MAG: type II secretion system F family protein [Polyangiales bacterium]